MCTNLHTLHRNRLNLNQLTRWSRYGLHYGHITGMRKKKQFVEGVDQVSQLHQLEAMSDCSTDEMYLLISIMH